MLYLTWKRTIFQGYPWMTWSTEIRRRQRRGQSSFWPRAAWKLWSLFATGWWNTCYNWSFWYILIMPRWWEWFGHILNMQMSQYLSDLWAVHGSGTSSKWPAIRMVFRNAGTTFLISLNRYCFYIGSQTVRLGTVNQFVIPRCYILCKNL